MRISILHSWYLSGDSSGENRVVLDEARLLREHGHDVDVWTPSPSPHGVKGAAKTASSALWSRTAARETLKRIDEFAPDVVHIHNVFPMLSPNVIRAAAGAGVPTVMTLHNYRLLCPAGFLMRDGKPCESCVGKLPVAAVRNKCFRGSTAGSAVVASSLALHRLVGSFDLVDRFAAVSGYVKQKHVEAGLHSERIAVKHNFAWPMRRREGPGDYFLFLGRISPEKGVDTLVKAWRPDLPELRIVGDGPAADELRRSAPANVTFTGAIASEEVPGVLGEARALLLPSRWSEGSPRSIFESYAAGVPVLASKLGALPEVVDHEHTGLLLEPDHPEAWAEAARALGDDDLVTKMGDAAYERWVHDFSPLAGLTALRDLYSGVITKAAA